MKGRCFACKASSTPKPDIFCQRSTDQQFDWTTVPPIHQRSFQISHILIPESAARHVDHVWFDTLYWYTSVGSLWHPKTKLVDSIKIKSNQKNSTTSVFMLHGTWQSRNLWDYIFFPPQQRKKHRTRLRRLVQPFQCLWCNIVVGTTCRMIRMFGREMHGNAAPPQSNYKLLFKGSWYFSLHSWKS